MDTYNLQRFIDAQDKVFHQACAELRSGKKRSHWMWFIFPQIEGLGHSDMARTFAISSLAEAKAYLDHPILGERLRECTRLVSTVQGRSIGQIFGYPDDMKFHSSMTLFSCADTDDQVFSGTLRKYFNSELDALTLKCLGLSG
ncbi:DUF1810 domain-containing protein [Pollutimonas bauzanensis]|uniref:DUF1810 domain-containing protein n=1 Tax=Pollutimonas bauzanensis TaxID=658167 RepID=UPI0033428E1A